MEMSSAPKLCLNCGIFHRLHQALAHKTIHSNGSDDKGVLWIRSISVTIFLSCHSDATRYFRCIKVNELG